MTATCLSREFYVQPCVTAARALLGMTLCRYFDGQLLKGRIVETECYAGMSDLASHGRSGRTARNLPMWEAPGHAYVYRSYGIHWMLNAVCESEGIPAAVLIRAVEPLEGIGNMEARRPGRTVLELTNGPGRLCQALAITGEHNRADLTETSSGIYIGSDTSVPEENVRSGPRVGLGATAEPWLSTPWRFWIAGNRFVSMRAGLRA